MNQKKWFWQKRLVLGLYWTILACVIFLILHSVGYSDGDDAFFYHYASEMGFFEYLSWRYKTWVGRMSGEALVYAAFRLGLGFWRVINALMLVFLPIGILQLGCKTAGYRGYLDYLDSLLKDCQTFGIKEIFQIIRMPLFLSCGYLLMSVMTFGYSAVWVNGSIFYTWSFTAGVWAMMPLADAAFQTGALSKKQFFYSVLFSIIASMSIEQMGAVLLAFEVLAMLKLFLEKKQVSLLIAVQFLVTLAAFGILLLAPGNEMRVESEIATWFPAFRELTFTRHLFLTMQWLLSSFANESHAYFIGIWTAASLLCCQKKRNKKSVSHICLCVGTVVFSAAALLPYFGVTVLSDLGLNGINIEECLTDVFSWQMMTMQNKIAFFWQIAAVLFTFVLLQRASECSVFVSMVYLGGIASEAVLHFSPTMYASGARVYYLTDLMYLFLILWLIFRFDSEKKKNGFIAAMLVLGVVHFFSQYAIVLLKL